MRWGRVVVGESNSNNFVVYFCSTHRKFCQFAVKPLEFMADTDFGQGPKKVSPKPQERSRGRGEGTARRCSKCHFELKVNEKHNSATFTTFPRLITSKPSNTCEAHKRCLCPCPYTCPLLRACHHLFLPYLTYIICWHS